MNDKRKALGKGLDSLLPAARAISAAAPAPAPEGEAVREIPLDLIDPNPYQTRGCIDEHALDELADSIKAAGVLQPIVVRPGPAARFSVIAGERRWLASKRAGRTTVPALVRPVSNEKAMEMTIIENLQRQDLNPVEQARAFDRLGREFGLTQEQIAQRTGKERSSVANYLRLLKLPLGVQSAMEGDLLSMGHAKVLLALETADAINKATSAIMRDSLSVRQTEELVERMLHPAEKPPQRERVVDPNVREAEKQLEHALGVRVKIQDRKGKGKILIEYKSLEDFDRVLEALSAQS
jgi:ParB family chromosome partitioning protein